MAYVTKINNIKFFSADPNYADFWNAIGLEGQKKLEIVIKDKVKFENEFVKKFFERYIHERDYHGLINTNFLFGHYSLISRVLYLMFFALKKEGKIIRDFITHLTEIREQAFFDTIIANEGTGNFQVGLDPYKIEIQNIVDNTNYDFMSRYIPNYILDKYYNKYFKTEPITFVGNDAKKNVLVKNNLYDFNSGYNFITVYSETENFAYMYLAPEITISDFNNIGITRYLLWKNLKMKNVKFYTISSQEEFFEFRDYITVFQEVQFKILHSVQTDIFKRWLMSSLVDKRIGDFSCYIYKGGMTQYSRIETEFNNNGYRSVLNNGVYFDKIKRDLQRLGVQLEGLTTLRNFNVGKVSYRISIINNDMSFQVSIRRTNNDYYGHDDIISNGFSPELLLSEKNLSSEDYKANYYKKLKDFGEGGTHITFTLSNFVNEKDTEDLHQLMYETTGFSYCIGETGSGKTTLLKVYFSEFYRHFLEKKIVKKMITLEAPIEEVDFNFYQIGYDLNNPEELREIVKATKTSKPDIVILGETKDTATMNMIYEEAQLHHSVSTIHKADILGFMNALVGYSIELEVSGTDMISKINFAIAMNKMKVVDTSSLEKNGLMLVYKNNEIIEKFLYSTFGMEFADEINKLLDSRQIRIINNQSHDETIYKINNDLYQKTYILYERLFKREVTAFMNAEFEEGTFISNPVLLNKIRNIYKYIGVRNRMIYKIILLYLTGKIIGVDEGKIAGAAEKVNGLSYSEKKEFIEALMDDLPNKLKTTSRSRES